MSTILDALQKAEQETVVGRRGRGGGPPAEPPRRRGPQLPRWLIAVAIVAVLAVAFVGGVTLDSSDDATDQAAVAPPAEGDASAPQQLAAAQVSEQAPPPAEGGAEPAAQPAAARPHKMSGDGSRHRPDGAAPAPHDKHGAGAANGAAPTTLGRVPYLPPGETTEGLRPGGAKDKVQRAREARESGLRGVAGDGAKRERKRDEVQARRDAIRQLGEARRTERAALTEQLAAAAPPPAAAAVPPGEPSAAPGAARADASAAAGAPAPEPAPAEVAAVAPEPEPAAPAAPGLPPPVAAAAAPEPPPAQSALAVRRPPTGAPNVAINIVWWSPVDERRMAFVSVDGGSMTQVREGDQVSGLTVKRIYQEMIEFGQGESSFLLRAN